MRAANSRARTRYARPALTTWRFPVFLATTATLPRPTSVTVPLQRSVVMKVLAPFAGVAVAAPPTVRNTPLAFVTSERTTVPLAGPLARHGRSAPGGLASSARGGIVFERFALRALRAWRIAKMPARKRASRLTCLRLVGRWPLTAASTATSPARVSSVDPIGTEATPLSDTKPLLWNGTRSPLVNALPVAPGGSFTNTSPEISFTVAAFPASIGALPGGRTSQASPTPSRSPSPCPAFAASGQLSEPSAIPSPSRSAVGRDDPLCVAGVASACPSGRAPVTVNVCAPSARPG